MKAVMPVLALLVAIVLVLSQALYTVDQRQYAIKFQLGEFIEAKTEAGLYFKIPLVQNVKFYDRRLLTLDAPEPDRITTPRKSRSRSTSSPTGASSTCASTTRA